MENIDDVEKSCFIHLIKKRYIAQKVIFYPEKKANIRVNINGNLFLDNGSKLEVGEEDNLWEWLYLNQNKLIQYKGITWV